MFEEKIMEFIKKHQKTSLMVAWILWCVIGALIMLVISHFFGNGIGGLVYFGVGFILIMWFVIRFMIDVLTAEANSGYSLGYEDGKDGIPLPNDTQIVRRKYSRALPSERGMFVSNYHKGYRAGRKKYNSQYRR